MPHEAYSTVRMVNKGSGEVVKLEQARALTVPNEDQMRVHEAGRQTHMLRSGRLIYYTSSLMSEEDMKDALESRLHIVGSGAG
jgi:hypothetical protein